MTHLSCILCISLRSSKLTVFWPVIPDKPVSPFAAFSALPACRPVKRLDFNKKAGLTVSTVFFLSALPLRVACVAPGDDFLKLAALVTLRAFGRKRRAGFD